MPTRAMPVPSASASAAFDSRSALMPRLCRFIHTIIAVTVPTATSPMIVSKPSCCFCGSDVLIRSSAIPTPRQISDRGDHADPHPSQRVAAIGPRQERRDDADDEGCLDPLSETDHEGRDHGRVGSSGTADARVR